MGYANRLTGAPMQDLYDLLGIPRNADIDTIKAAYRRKAKVLHPDVGGSATDFELISLARRVLTDHHLREQYDRTGYADLNSEDTRQQQALTILTSLLQNVLTSVPRIDIVDLVAAMRTNLADVIRQGHAALRTGEQKIERLQQVRDRITVKSGKPNRLAALLDGQIRIEQGTKERCKEQIAVHELARDILDDYGYKTDQVQPLVFYSSVPF